MEKANGSVR